MNHCRGFLESFRSEVCEGYDECFDPPLDKKYECPICLLGLREPVQTPCGHRFCQDCILRSISDAGQKCPVDNEHLEDWQLYPDNFARREMLNHPVFCRLIKLYHCPWKGPLGKLQDHFKECDFVDVFCPKSCGKEFLRKDLKRHLEDDCPNRTISCTFCGEELLWNSLEDHCQDCPQYLLSCEKCGTENIPRNKMQDHNEKECPMAELRCPLSVGSCPFKGPRPAVDAHVKDNLLSHLADLIKELKKSCPRSTSGGVEAQEQASQDGNLETLCQQHQTEIASLRDLVNYMGGMIERLEYQLTESQNRQCMRLNNLESSRQQQSMEIDGFLNELLTRVERPLQEFSIRSSLQEARMCELEGRVCNGTYTWRIENYQQHRQAAINGSETWIISPAFYTSLSGYKLCLRINLNGVGSGVGRYIALFVHMMQGDYDDSLEWPFTGRITLTILDQSEVTRFHQHISESLIAEPNHLASQRPTAPVNLEGYSCVAIAPIEHIREPQYINNNTMLVRIQIAL